MPKEIIKNLPSLSELLLRGNTLCGSIPEELCRLPSLHLLDLAENNLSGSIPKCWVMCTEEWLNILIECTIDLSNNNLSGEIPEELTELIHLGALNLSWNKLIGHIPNNIGSLTNLESLELLHKLLLGPVSAKKPKRHQHKPRANIIRNSCLHWACMRPNGSKPNNISD
ncbi:hypothetical protein Fmac_009005 [Flemingia macrophylla]|uniref:Uncharacterized protein n=1 Tax=Flemingia macrophylla TaxID=520843 RepID=A0ABD1MZ01_9FABA